MQAIVADVGSVKFDIEIALEQQLGVQPLPFPGMDKAGMAVCTFHMKTLCSKGSACPFRHVSGDREIVCKHWLRGLCKKGDECEFLHEYDMSKMPECFFFSKFGACSNRECPFLHIDPDAKKKDCAWYDRGFCRHGPNCKNRHVRRILCEAYLCGFCTEGLNCKFAHPRFEIPVADPSEKVKKMAVVCHSCGEFGHKAIHCTRGEHPNVPRPAGQPMITPASIPPVAATGPAPIVMPTPTGMTGPMPIDPSNGGQRPREPFVRRNLEEVTCFKCGDRGHYANRCPRGNLAFLHMSGTGVAQS